MKIEVKDKNDVLFKDIEAGDVFQHGDYYYLKVSATFRIKGADFNAIDLEDGDPILFDDKDEVFVPSAKLIIE